MRYSLCCLRKQNGQIFAGKWYAIPIPFVLLIFIAAGGRTGLTSVVCGLLFLISLFFAPLVGITPAQATAPVLILVGFLMLSTVQHIQWNKIEEALPAFLIIVTIPYTYSISRGIGFGFISYLLIMLAQKRFRDIHPMLVVVSLLFALSFALS